MLLYAISLLAGIGLLTLGGDLLIRGALATAQRLGVSPLLTGLVIVGFGTSAPELVVSVNAALDGQPDIAVGNIIGSNISNVLLILGLCALVTPLTVQPLALKRDGLIAAAASALFLLLAWNDSLSRGEAVVSLLALVAYLTWAYRSESRRPATDDNVYAQEAQSVSTLPGGWFSTGLLIVAGLALLIGGSRLLLYGAVGIAESAGVPEALIGLTLVAVGTSLPELAVSLIAALRRQADVAVGNILGSNLFNLLGILGVAALLQPLSVAARIQAFDQWVLLGSALVLLAFLYTGLRLSRLEGGVLLAGYGVYLGMNFLVF